MKDVMVIVYFDIETAYESMWREGLLIKLHNMGIGGRMNNWILGFLSNWTVCVKVEDDVSNYFNTKKVWKRKMER